MSPPTRTTSLDSVDRIQNHYDALLDHGLVTATMGGDHTIVLPILRAMAKRHGPVGLVHVDAHTDINDTMFGERIAHGTPFRRAVEEGLLDCSRVAQIGVRGTGYQADDFDWSREQGFRVVQVEECWHRSLDPLMAEIRTQLGDGPGVPQLRHRRSRPVVCAWHRHTRDRRPHDLAGHRDHPRLPQHAARRLRRGRGRAHLRRVGHDLAGRRQPALRDAVRAARSRVPLAPDRRGRGTLPEPRPQASGGITASQGRRMRSPRGRAYQLEQRNSHCVIRLSRKTDCGSAEADGETAPCAEYTRSPSCSGVGTPASTASVSPPAGASRHDVRSVGRRQIDHRQPVAVTHQLSVTTRHARVAFQCDLGMDVARLAGPADQRGALCQRDGRRRRPAGTADRPTTPSTRYQTGSTSTTTTHLTVESSADGGLRGWLDDCGLRRCLTGGEVVAALLAEQVGGIVRQPAVRTVDHHSVATNGHWDQLYHRDRE